MSKICVVCGTDLGERFASKMRLVGGFWIHDDCQRWFDARLARDRMKRGREPNKDCELCGTDRPHLCYHPDRAQPIGPGPHFWRPQCRWLLNDDACPLMYDDGPRKDENGMPILPGWPTKDGKQVRVMCVFCGHFHFHGLSQEERDGALGHRVAHCHNPDSPYNESGYYIRVHEFDFI